ncbi:hypothetical protein [uncultured Sphingomonas sp.]|uniref:hypothetical protein n=1 Tax=uncultured Sphingomonas sp. TaxID=158754 RepID=UPI0025FE219E|nr:hypothetical protein [uncultured Sphingomonas sp.]
MSFIGDAVGSVFTKPASNEANMRKARNDPAPHLIWCDAHIPIANLESESDRLIRVTATKH